ncbi:hypothetical protein OCL06_04440 [Alteromonas sp. ASW11-19]|uniref:Uncharacterized protein n=1 Tax=Alteromonas salexigens TaxID=2982530 RepID=A0ABT2VNL5_9ALTE|nr:hypothetical protein [Alteromonas salexigens]MCU7553841.1 hypothetical protein [Alteromonas salexigens]
MNKLLLSTVSVMAFATAATQAAETSQNQQSSELIKSAEQAITLNDLIPDTNLSGSVKQQASSALALDAAVSLSKRMFAVRKDKRTERTLARSE